jgi:hypothetical protein
LSVEALRGFVQHFSELLLGLVEFFLALENRAEQEAGHFLARRGPADFFRRVDSLFGLGPALALLRRPARYQVWISKSAGVPSSSARSLETA